MLKLFQTFLNLSISNFSTSDFILAKLISLAKSDVSSPVAFIKSNFFAQLGKSNSTFTFAPIDFGFRKYSFVYALPFLWSQMLNELLYPLHLTYNLSPFFSNNFF